SDLDFDWEALSEQLKDGTLEAFVLADERQANAMQLDFVPYFLINGTSAIQGALESEQMLMALNEAYQNS
ncbi:MAG: hypothetical protein PWP24_93, partial [Clostridiales bacterium]|nr:hypothetical protein [Clostridiales bacterium]